MTLLLSHPASLDHLTPPGHPERPDRIRAVEQVLGEASFDRLVRETAPEGSLDQVLLCHYEHYVEELRHIAPSSGLVYLDGDTSMSPGTWEAVMRGVGGAVAATDAVMAGTHHNAFVAMRPPGHHAETGKPMGFCFFDHAAIAARHAQRKYGIERAAVVDFDVHHGNGTEDILLNRPGVEFFSVHQHPAYPNTGAANRGRNCFNYPVAPSAPREHYRATLARALGDLKNFSPDLIAVSAGFDAYARDPLAQGTLLAGDFNWLGRELRALETPFFSLLEGGYSRDLPELIFAYLKGIEGK